MYRSPVVDFNEARNAGMTPTRAAHWAAYRVMKASRNERPITLRDALAQIKAVSA